MAGRPGISQVVMKADTNAEKLLFSTLRIVTSSSIGTGAIIEHEGVTDQWGHPSIFLVTNKHVIENTAAGTLTFTRVLGATDLESTGPDVGRRFTIKVEEQAWSWIGHPDSEIDVACLPLSGLLRQIQHMGMYPFIVATPGSLVPSERDRDYIDAIEDVLFVGYPNGIYDEANNLPIVRRGITATPLYVDYGGKPRFLIDGSVFPGSSGSPVFLYNNGLYSKRNGTPGEMAIGGRVRFLGILASVFYRQNDGTLEFREIPSSLEAVVKGHEMLDLGIVYKASTVFETIDYAISSWKA